MPIKVPNSVNYSSPLNAVPLNWQRVAPEGPKGIECEIDWGTMGGPNNSVFLNLQNNQALEFSQITALVIDNSQCGSDIQFTFPDTQTTATIPAYAPYNVIPVFTNQKSFWVTALGEEPEDVTRFMILNTVPQPVTVPTSQEQNVAAIASSGINSGSGTIQILAPGINGTIENMYGITNLFDAFNVGGNASFTLVDGSGKVIAQASLAVNEQSQTNLVLFNSSLLNVRFQNVLKVNWTASQVSSGNFNMNVYYRTP